MRNFDAASSDWCFPEGYSLVGLAHWNKFHASVLVSAKLMAAVGGYDPGVPWGLEDWNFWLHAALHRPVVRFVPEATFWYRQHAGASMRKHMFAAHLEETKACVRTLHSGLYEPAQLLRDHETVAAMARCRPPPLTPASPAASACRAPSAAQRGEPSAAQRRRSGSRSCRNNYAFFVFRLAARRETV